MAFGGDLVKRFESPDGKIAEAQTLLAAKP
jgi:hypothetical protein